jgi:hypothetical protein
LLSGRYRHIKFGNDEEILKYGCPSDDLYFWHNIGLLWKTECQVSWLIRDCQLVVTMGNDDEKSL